MRRIFEAYYSVVYTSVLRLVKEEATAEDLSQDLFLSLWKNRFQTVISTSLEAYLRRAATNRALNYLRDRKLLLDEGLEEETLTATEPSEHLRLEGQELQEAIDKAIDALPDRCRVVFVLSRYEGLKYTEIAQEMGISVKTVEHQISRALRDLRVALKPYLK